MLHAESMVQADADWRTSMHPDAFRRTALRAQPLSQQLNVPYLDTFTSACNSAIREKLAARTDLFSAISRCGAKAWKREHTQANHPKATVRPSSLMARISS
jgi:hypothetical protein